MTITSLLQFKKIGFLTPFLQILFVLFLAITTAIYYYRQHKETGKIHGLYPLRPHIYIVVFLEEFIFRDLLFVGFLSIVSPFLSILYTSILFGLAHLRNIPYMSKQKLLEQILYASFIFGPVTGIVTYLTGSIWIAVILHYINNLSNMLFLYKHKAR